MALSVAVQSIGQKPAALNFSTHFKPMPRLIPLLLLPFTLAAKDLSLEIPSLRHPVKVSLPENFDPSKKHPTLFYYHGTSGRPTTDLMRTHAGPNDWIIVGMTYTHRGRFTLSKESMAAELKAYHSVRQQMIAQHSSDPDKLYTSGFSLGGWYSDLMLQAEPSLAGGIIIGAGHAQIPPGALAKYATKKPVHIAVGRNDPNYLFTLKAFLYHRKLGGNVSMEVWQNLAHTYPQTGSDSIRQWLKLQNNSSDDLAATAEKELNQFLSKAKSLAPLAQWDRLREIKEMPYYKLSSKEWQTDFKKVLATLEASPVIATEVPLYREHRRLHHQEITNQTLTTIKKVNAAYLNLSSKFPKTRQAKLMEEDFKRTEAILKQIKVVPSEKKPTEVPSSPIPQRRIPGNPLIR